MTGFKSLFSGLRSNRVGKDAENKQIKTRKERAAPPHTPLEQEANRGRGGRKQPLTRSSVQPSRLIKIAPISRVRRGWQHQGSLLGPQHSLNHLPPLLAEH